MLRDIKRKLQIIISHICVGNLVSRPGRYLIRAEKHNTSFISDQSMQVNDGGRGLSIKTAQNYL